MVHLIAVSSPILCIIMCIPIFLGAGHIIISAFNYGHAFLVSHLVFSITALVVLLVVMVFLHKLANLCIALIANRQKPFSLKIKDAVTSLFLKWKLILMAVFVYSYFVFVMGSPFSLSNIFNIALPIKVFYTDTELNPGSAFMFPFWKTYGFRVWNDLPIHKKTFPSFHCKARSIFYREYGKQEILRRKEIVCILKNVGDQTLIVQRINNIRIKRGPTPIDDKFEILFKSGDKVQRIVGLANILNIRNEITPIVLYPLEEIVLFNINPDVYGELLTVDIEIAYADFPAGSNNHVYRQIDEVKFYEDSPRNVDAVTKYTCSVE